VRRGELLAHDHLLSVIPSAAEESARSDSREDARPREGPFEPRNARAVHSPRWQAARLFKQTVSIPYIVAATASPSRAKRAQGKLRFLGFARNDTTKKCTEKESTIIAESSSGEESHPSALTEPDVRLSP